MVIYSPTSTEAYQQCPQRYVYSREYKRLTTSSEWTPNLALGQAVHAGLAAFFTGEGWRAAADATLASHYQSNPRWPLKDLQQVARRGVQAGIKTGIQTHGEILAVEQRLHGCIVDLVYRSTHGQLVTVDHKTVLTAPAQHVWDRLRKYETSWQFAHEAWAAGEEFGAGDASVLACVHLIVLQPRAKAYTHMVEYTAERRQVWYAQAQQWWAMMESGVKLQNWQHCQAYGAQRRCEFYEACHVLDGDTSKFPIFYAKKA